MTQSDAAASVARPSLAPRDRFVDLLRVTAVAVVVFGHWITASVIWTDDAIIGENALSFVSWSHYATWILQVMPVLFFVGGFANATSWEVQEGHYPAYLRTRLVRLMTPTAVFLGVWLAIGAAIDLVDPASPNALARGAQVAALPFWFLGIYLAVVALAPLMLRLHERAGALVPFALAAGTAVVDVVRLGFDIPHVGVANYAFVWLFCHQLGFLYRDGMLTQHRHTGPLIAGSGLAAMTALTGWGPYATSMVGVPGEDFWNTDPPSLPLVALALWLIGLALMSRPAATRLLAGAATWRVVRLLNRRVLTAYLWHVSALSIVVALLYPRGFPQPETGSGEWWAARPLWIAALVPSLALLIVVFGRFEVHPAQVPTSGEYGSVRLVATGFGIFSLVVGAIGFGVAGFVDIAGTGSAVLAFRISPLLSVLHVMLGGAVVATVWRSDAAAGWATLAGAAVFALIGLVGAAGSAAVTWLGMNAATGILQLVVSALTGLLLAATWRANARSRPAPI